MSGRTTTVWAKWPSKWMTASTTLSVWHVPAPTPRCRSTITTCKPRIQEAGNGLFSTVNRRSTLVAAGTKSRYYISTVNISRWLKTNLNLVESRSSICWHYGWIGIQWHSRPGFGSWTGSQDPTSGWHWVVDIDPSWLSTTFQRQQPIDAKSSWISLSQRGRWFGLFRSRIRLFVQHCRWRMRPILQHWTRRYIHHLSISFWLTFLTLSI